MEKKELYINHKLIDKFCDAMAQGLVNRSKEPAVDVWPQPIFNPLIGNYFTHKEVIHDLYLIFDKLLKEKNFGLSKIASLFAYPSRTAHLMYLFMEDSKTEEETKIRSFVCSKLLEVIQILRNGNPFCDKGKNVVWNTKSIDEVLERYEIHKVDNLPETKKLISKLIVALSGYCEFLYFANLAFGREFHGPYETKYGKLLVREYFDLQPMFWNFSKTFPFKKIMFITIYPSDIHIAFDFAGRLRSDKTLAPNLKYVTIIIDGKEFPLTSKDLTNLLDQIGKFLRNATLEVLNLEKENLMIKWIEAYFWTLKPFKDLLNKPWSPPQEIYLKIKQEKPDTWLISVMKSLASMPVAMRFDIMKKVFDPRITDKKNKILSTIEKFSDRDEQIAL